ncbi:MAG TPA: hypothetical protein VIG24_13530 [Acidimicrobiia bacterium]
MRVALITASYGAFDPVRPLPEWHGFDDAVCVTDDAGIVGSGWRTHIEPRDEHPRLAAKRPKMLPWLFTDCDAAVWIDASFEIVGRNFSWWARKHLDRDDFVAWRHPEGRIDFADEAAVCQDWPKYRDYPIREQVQHYLQQGMPRRWGLFACGTLGYVLKPEVKRLASRWYDENLKWSLQDQVSLPYLLWDSGLPFGTWQAHEYQNEYLRLRWDERPNPNA